MKYKNKRRSKLYSIIRETIDEAKLIPFQNPLKLYANTMKSMFFRRRKSKYDNSRQSNHIQNANENKAKDQKGSAGSEDTFI